MARKQTVKSPAAEVQEKVGEVQAYVIEQLEEARRRLIATERELVALGRTQQKEIEALLERVKSGKELKLLEKRASEATREVKKRLDLLQGQVLGALGVASHEEVDQIGKELSRLSKKVDQLLKKSPPTAQA